MNSSGEKLVIVTGALSKIMPFKPVDIIGEKFGSLDVIKVISVKKTKWRNVYLYLCYCNNCGGFETNPSVELTFRKKTVCSLCINRRNCDWCGKEFISKRNGGCSDYCTNEKTKERQRKYLANNVRQDPLYYKRKWRAFYEKMKIDHALRQKEIERCKRKRLNTKPEQKIRERELKRLAYENNKEQRKLTRKKWWQNMPEDIKMARKDHHNKKTIEWRKQWIEKIRENDVDKYLMYKQRVNSYARKHEFKKMLNVASKLMEKKNNE